MSYGHVNNEDSDQTASPHILKKVLQVVKLHEPLKEGTAKTRVISRVHITNAPSDIFFFTVFFFLLVREVPFIMEWKK